MKSIWRIGLLFKGNHQKHGGLIKRTVQNVSIFSLTEPQHPSRQLEQCPCETFDNIWAFESRSAVNCCFCAEAQLFLWKPLQGSYCRAMLGLRGEILSLLRLFTASLHVGTVYGPRGCCCQKALLPPRAAEIQQRGFQPHGRTTLCNPRLWNRLLSSGCHKVKGSWQPSGGAILPFCIVLHLHFQFPALRWFCPAALPF